ncbi:MAG: PAS domain S-box protein [Chloroflexota bacterium]
MQNQSFIPEQLSDSIIENVHVWLNALDINLNIVLWNATAERLSGYGRDEVQGHNQIWTWLYPDETYCDQITAEVQSVLSTERGYENYETTILCKDGQTRTMSWNTQSWQDEDGHIQGALCFGYDITERRRAREVLQDAPSELSVLYEIASIASSSTELNSILESSLEIVLSTMRSSKGIIHVVDKRTESLRLAAHMGLLYSDIRQIETLPFDSDLMGKVVRQGIPLVLPNLAIELANLKSVPANLLHSYLGAPMRAKGKVYVIR